MKTLFYLLLLITILGCKEQIKSESNSQPIILEKTKEKINIPFNVDSDFEIFLEYFSKDSVFQVSRIKFPLKITELDWEMNDFTSRTIQHKDYEVIDFSYDKSIETKEFDAFTQEVKQEVSKATIEIRGIDNGIHCDFEFEKIDGEWKMVSRTDAST